MRDIRIRSISQSNNFRLRYQSRLGMSQVQNECSRASSNDQNQDLDQDQVLNLETRLKKFPKIDIDDPHRLNPKNQDQSQVKAFRSQKLHSLHLLMMKLSSKKNVLNAKSTRKRSVDFTTETSKCSNESNF